MTLSDKSTLTLHPDDNIVVALKNLRVGDVVCDGSITVSEEVKRGHKICVKSVKQSTNILKFGQIVGAATQDIAAGTLVHTHNLSMGAHTQDYGHASANGALPVASGAPKFMGYRRENGKVGTRNYVGIVTTVNCSGSVAKFIAEVVEKEGFLKGFPNVDGVVPIVHGTGCGMSGSGEGYDTLFRTLTGYVQHPNFGAILLVGLGCEVMTLSALVGDRKISTNGALRYMTIQNAGGTRKTVDLGVAMVRELATISNETKRTATPASELVIGMQCGGSDGYSGITANPVLGLASDLLVRHGGTTILSETSEIYGAEHLLTRRAVTPEVGEMLIERVRWWEDYCARNGGEMDNNPSPGNKAGGLTTILEKSLGAVAKAGSAQLSGVYKYAEPIDKRGLVFMDSPGYDPCSVTGQVASGANLIVFTTGRGSVSGYKPSPCIKIASNSEMYARLSEDMDLNCGEIITGGVSLKDKSEELFQIILNIASGTPSKSEAQGFGGVEFVPWKIGAVM